jgi:hypothetical protein
LASKYGFIRVMSFPANVVKVVKHNRKQLCHSLRVKERKLVNVVETAVHLVAHELKGKVQNANSAEIALRERRENDLQEESDRHKVVRDHLVRHVRRENDLLARRETDPVDPDEMKARPRKSQQCKKLRMLLRMGYPKFRMSRQPQRLKFRMLLRTRHLKFRRPRNLRPRHHRHLLQTMALLRASRGDSKPCYWHHHDINTANSIAVA